jgi:hypothetical protein
VAQKEGGEMDAWFWFRNLPKKEGFENQGIVGGIVDLRKWQVAGVVNMKIIA